MAKTIKQKPGETYAEFLKRKSKTKK